MKESSIKPRKPSRITTVIILLILGLTAVSWKQIKFFFLFTRYSLNANLSHEKHQAAFLRSYRLNSRIHPLMSPYLENHKFLSLFAADAVKDDLNVLRTQKKVRDNILARFSGNIFLDHPVGLNPIGAVRHSIGIDTLFLTFIQDQALNRYTFEVLTRNENKAKIGTDLWAGIILFLNWKENFALADRLIQWGKQDARFDPESILHLEHDYFSRKNKPGKGCRGKASAEDLLGSVAEVTGLSSPEYILLVNPDFGNQARFSEAWILEENSGSSEESKITFNGGVDEYENCSMRLMSFFSEKGHVKARAEYRYRDGVKLKEDRLYVLYFRYKAPTGKENPAAGFTRRPRSIPALKATGDQWKEVYYFLDNRSLKLPQTGIFFRMEGEGSVWFDDINLFELQSMESSINNEAVTIR